MVIGGILFGIISCVLFIIYMFECCDDKYIIGSCLSLILCILLITGYIYRVNHADMSKIYHTLNSVDHGSSITIKTMECVYIPYDFDNCEVINTKTLTYDTNVDRIKIIQGIK